MSPGVLSFIAIDGAGVYSLLGVEAMTPLADAVGEDDLGLSEKGK